MKKLLIEIINYKIQILMLDLQYRKKGKNHFINYWNNIRLKKFFCIMKKNFLRFIINSVGKILCKMVIPQYL